MLTLFIINYCTVINICWGLFFAELVGHLNQQLKCKRMLYNFIYVSSDINMYEMHQL